MARARVEVHERFRELESDLDRAVSHTLNEAAAIGAAAARATPTGKYQIAGILGLTRVELARRTAKGWQAEIVCPHPLAYIFTKGSYTKRSGKLKRARVSSRANKGVRPVRFIQRGRREAAKVMLPLLRANVGEWKP